MAWTVPTIRTTGELITASIWNTDLGQNLQHIINSNGNLALSTVGPHAIGGAVSTRFGLQIAGSIVASGAGGHDVGMIVTQGLTVQAGNFGSLVLITGTLVEAGSGTHPDLAALRVTAPAITNNGAVTTNAHTLLIDGAPTAGVSNYALRVASGLASFGGQINLDGLTAIQGPELHTNIVSPAQITGNTDNYSPTGLGTARILRLSTDASRNLTGIVAQQTGRRLLLQNVGAFDLVLTHDATSTAANRFLLPGNANLTLNTQDGVEVWYDGGSSRWRAVRA